MQEFREGESEISALETNLETVVERLRSQLSLSGFAVLNLYDHLKSTTVSDSIIRRIGSSFTSKVAGTEVSDATIVRPIPGSDYTTLSQVFTPFHNDGLYLYHHPTYILLFCDKQAEIGGENYFVRGDHAFMRLPKDLRRYLETHKLRATTGDYSVARYWVDTHPQDRSRVVLFHDPRLQISVQDFASNEQGRAIERLSEVIESGDRQAIRMTEGDLLLIDNYKVLHARDMFVGDRRLRRFVIRKHARHN